MEARFERCGSYDINGEPMTLGYEKNDPIRGLNQITASIADWAERYLAGESYGQKCKRQPKRQKKLASKWNWLIAAKYVRLNPHLG